MGRKTIHKRGVLVISSGSSNMEAIRVSLGSIENMISEEFKDWEVRRAFTSEAIIEKLRKNSGIIVDNVEKALKKMNVEGFENVILQPLHIIPGSEYEKIVETLKKYKTIFKNIALGRPILYYEKDYKRALDALRTQVPCLNHDEAVVLVGHGTKHTSNIFYKRFQEIIDEEGLRFYVVTLDEYPTIYDIISKLKKDEVRKIFLMPFMLFFGGHGMRDIAGDKDDSLKNILKREEFGVSIYEHGLGENIEYQKIYLQHVKDVMY
jgi:sirohydrochlorin cobaltochelatase